MTTLEAGLRGAAIAVLVLLALFGWRDARRVAVARYAVLFVFCGIAYLIESAPGLAFSQPLWVVPVRVLSVASPAVFVLWTSANFDDSFAPSWASWLPAGAMVALVGWAVILGGDLAWRIVQVAALALVGFGLWQVLGGRAGDLVEGRRRFRLVLAIGVGLSIVAFIALGAVSYSSPRIRDYGGVASAGIVLALGLASAMFRLGVRPSPPLEVDPAGPRRELTAATPIAIDPEERALLDRLRHLMESERIYREEGLGVGALAARLGLPEYRLRRLINQRLGHRNFSSFVNGYRLAETAAALADPAQAQVPVLTIALDAGFQSIGPFNRAFKAQTGMTPTDFRRERLERAAAAPLGAPIPKSASI